MLLIQLLLNRVSVRIVSEAASAERLTTTSLDRAKFLLLLDHGY